LFFISSLGIFSFRLFYRCRPCQQFTPILSEYYEEIKKSKGEKQLEIVWISSDHSINDFFSYYTKMPWYALPYDKVHKVYNQLASLYAVKGIPHFVLLDGKTLEIITLNGREAILSDRYGLQFPYHSKGNLLFSKLLPTTYLKSTFSLIHNRLKSIIKAFLVSLLPQNLFPKIMSLLFRKKASSSHSAIVSTETKGSSGSGSGSGGSNNEKKKKTGSSATSKKIGKL
jgi:thiol-disulfide isomerase/thioredoxin